VALRRAHVDGRLDAVDFLHAQHVGQMLRQRGKLEEGHRVGRDAVGHVEEGVETVDADKDALPRCRRDADVVQPGGKRLEVLQPGCEHIDALVERIDQKLAQVALIRVQRVLRESFFQF